MGRDSVGTLLAEIANLLLDGLKLLRLADKRHWGPDEHEQHRALDVALNEAKKDYQELPPLLNGQAQYEHDRNHETIEELRTLRDKFKSHIQNLRDWIRSGGPINPIWIRETHRLQRELHQAQCRAARRIFSSSRESKHRCLGAFLVQRAVSRLATTQPDEQRWHLEELGACMKVGSFERFGNEDIAFICDFCDGHLVWEDLESVPIQRSAAAPAPNAFDWQATGISASGPQEKQVIWAPIVVANHLPPALGEWMTSLLCVQCEEEAKLPQEQDDDEDLYRPNTEFEDVPALQEHFEWQHSGGSVQSAAGSSSSCVVM